MACLHYLFVDNCQICFQQDLVFVWKSLEIHIFVVPDQKQLVEQIFTNHLPVV